MQTAHSKALIISPWWAGIFASCITAGMIGLAAFVIDAKAQIAVTNNQIIALKQDVSDIKDTKIEPRLTRIETKMDWLIEQTQRKPYGKP